MRTRMEQERTALDTQIRGVLNADQARRFDELRTEEQTRTRQVRERRSERDDRRRNEDRMQRPRGQRPAPPPRGN